VYGSDIYAGGQFTLAGGVEVVNFAKWDGNSWSGFGSGIGGQVWAVAASSSNLYVGGHFTTAGNSSTTNVATWNGFEWSALDSGVDFFVNALAVSGSDLYVGGNFSTAGGLPVHSIAKWDGQSWSDVGGGVVNGGVSALAVSGTDLYVGGNFTAAGGVAATNIAKWNGTNWSALGPGLSGYNSFVNVLAALGSNVYAGGSFTNSGGARVNYLAKWDGQSWSEMVSGLNLASFSPPVKAIAISGTNVFLGGYLTIGTNTSPMYIASWNGDTLAHYDSGVILAPSTLMFAGDDMYSAGAAGVYLRQITQSEARLAKRIPLRPPLLSISLTSANGAKISWPASYGDFVLQRNSGLNTNWSASPDTITDDGSIKYIIVNQAISGQYYRLFRP